MNYLSFQYLHVTYICPNSLIIQAFGYVCVNLLYFLVSKNFDSHTTRNSKNDDIDDQSKSLDPAETSNIATVSIRRKRDKERETRRWEEFSALFGGSCNCDDGP